MTTSPLPERIHIIEVGPRDGFQMESQFVPTELKIEVIAQLAESGIREIEVTSFVHPKVIPQMADAAEVLGGVRERSGVRWSVLIPNLKGAERALEIGVDELRLVVCATESYNQQNVGLTIDESAELFSRIQELAGGRSVDTAVVFGVALGCPIEGKVPLDRLLGLTERFVRLGASSIGVSDSYGVANPIQIASTVRAVREVLGEVRFWLHLHNTRGMGMANALVAMEEGVDSFDTAFGGLGGTPIMKGASGNLATEDLVYMCTEMGLDTGVDLDALRRVSRRMEEFFQRQLPSQVLAAGTMQELIELNRG